MSLDKRDFPGATFPEWLHKYTSTRITGNGKERVKVTAGLHYLKGNRLPHFSVTCDIEERRGSRWEDVGGGASHDLIGRLWPKLAPIIALHLSDSDGVPMYAEANGWYQLSGYYGGAGERYTALTSERHFPITPPADKPWQTTEYRKPTPDECLVSWAEYVRIPLDRARELADGWRETVQTALKTGAEYTPLKRQYELWVAAQADRWAQEAADGCALLDGLIAAQAAKAAKQEG